MSIDEARKWIIVSSLSITGVQMVFLLIAPTVGFPLPYPKNLDLLQIVSPVFLGYLGAASHFIFRNPGLSHSIQNQYLGLLIKGSVFVYSAAIISAFGAFSYSNRGSATINWIRNVCRQSRNSYINFSWCFSSYY